MSFAQSQSQSQAPGTSAEIRLAPGMTISLPTNNPFRKGAPSPALHSPSSPAFNLGNASRPVSRNPFLDQPDNIDSDMKQQTSTSSVKQNLGRMSPTKTDQGNNHTVELFNNLSMSDKPSMNENLPPSMNGRSGHRLTRSQEEEQRIRNGGKLRGPGPTLDIFADPPEVGKSRERRPRRNSESSIVDRNGKPVDLDEERRRRERRHRERDARHRDNKNKPIPSASSKPKKPSHRLDVIDKLDVTSIYGTGLFHHDGPFDACNPHRNRKGSQRAPMQAFPKDSANNVIGGSGPVNKNIDIAQFHGHTADGFEDYSAPAVANPATEPPVFEPYVGASVPYRGDARPGIDRTTSFNPGAKTDIVHGHETMGLGTSTFLEGAPAPRIAIQRRQSESENPGASSGLERKRSLAQKIRGISNARNNTGARGVNSPEPVYEVIGGAGDAQSAGGLRKIKETNPFFNDYDDAYEKKGARIQIAEEQNRAAANAATGGQGRARAPSSPMRGFTGAAPLERRMTSDTSGHGTLDTGETRSGGFLSRVRSLRGGRKPRP